MNNHLAAVEPGGPFVPAPSATVAGANDTGATAVVVGFDRRTAVVVDFD